MALSVGINREAQVAFSLSEVKSAIEGVALKSAKRYQIEGKDDVMNTFNIALVGGFAVIVPVALQLRKISESETQIILTSNKVFPHGGNQANDIVDTFLKKVSNSLSGTLDDVKAKTNSGCLGVSLLLLGGLFLSFLGVFYLIS